MNSGERQLRELAKAEGLEVLECSRTGSSHLRSRLRAADGRTGLCFSACSPSDRRASNNLRAWLRRFARGKTQP